MGWKRSDSIPERGQEVFSGRLSVCQVATGGSAPRSTICSLKFNTICDPLWRRPRSQKVRNSPYFYPLLILTISLQMFVAWPVRTVNCAYSTQCHGFLCCKYLVHL
jgi:hypothetical protein